jgi:hypothetical protein
MLEDGALAQALVPPVATALETVLLEHPATDSDRSGRRAGGLVLRGPGEALGETIDSRRSSVRNRRWKTTGTRPTASWQGLA